MPFQRLFCTDIPARDKFLSRLFGIFSEEIVRYWARDPHSRYEDLGRPTIKRKNETTGFTLDFTFRSRTSDRRVYIAEMKCELEYQNYRYLTLESFSQLDHHRKEAFRLFLDAARNINGYVVEVKGRPQPIHGSILVWGRCTEPGRESTTCHYGFADVLSVENIVRELLDWQNEEFANLIHRYETWCGELFAGLRAMGKPLTPP